mmetsp:Transcript_29109/g.58244  ORF Transcript_29109/g.58244 Transcript_29109/m.58244 type:complete len:149 (-) Transcript_29109:709-1155(-)
MSVKPLRFRKDNLQYYFLFKSSTWTKTVLIKITRFSEPALPPVALIIVVVVVVPDWTKATTTATATTTTASSSTSTASTTASATTASSRTEASRLTGAAKVATSLEMTALVSASAAPVFGVLIAVVSSLGVEETLIGINKVGGLLCEL